METFPAEQPVQEKLISLEKKSFDALASVDMLRYDLQRFGYILPETQERVCDEELSYVTEGIDRAFKTSFVLRRQADEIVYFKDGSWQPYTGTLLTGLEVAQREAVDDPRRQFLVERASFDLVQGYAMRGLQPGQQLVWHSAYPAVEAQLYGTDFIESLGFKADRQMGFIYRAQCIEDGQILLESQTVDRSDADAFRAVETVCTYDMEADLDTLLRVYDGALVKKHGGRFYAGRRNAEHKENVWNQVRANQDLIGYFLHNLELLAAKNLGRDQLTQQAKRERYAFWAALSTRLDKQPEPSRPSTVRFSFDPAVLARLRQESDQALHQFVSQGRMLIGCGGATLLSGDAIMQASTEDVFSALFGNQNSKPEAYSFDKKMHCVVCQAPPEPKASKKWCGPCGICKLCDTKIQARAK